MLKVTCVFENCALARKVVTQYYLFRHSETFVVWSWVSKTFTCLHSIWWLSIVGASASVWWYSLVFIQFGGYRLFSTFNVHHKLFVREFQECQYFL